VTADRFPRLERHDRGTTLTRTDTKRPGPTAGNFLYRSRATRQPPAWRIQYRRTDCGTSY